MYENRVHLLQQDQENLLLESSTLLLQKQIWILKNILKTHKKYILVNAIIFLINIKTFKKQLVAIGNGAPNATTKSIRE